MTTQAPTGSGPMVTPRQFAEWCVEVERRHEASYDREKQGYNLSFAMALAESSVPEAWQGVVGLLVWNQTFADLWEWCEKQGVPLA